MLPLEQNTTCVGPKQSGIQAKQARTREVCPSVRFRSVSGGKIRKLYTLQFYLTRGYAICRRYVRAVPMFAVHVPRKF